MRAQAYFRITFLMLGLATPSFAADETLPWSAGNQSAPDLDPFNSHPLGLDGQPANMVYNFANLCELNAGEPCELNAGEPGLVQQENGFINWTPSCGLHIGENELGYGEYLDWMMVPSYGFNPAETGLNHDLNENFHCNNNNDVQTLCNNNNAQIETFHADNSHIISAVGAFHPDVEAALRNAFSHTDIVGEPGMEAKSVRPTCAKEKDRFVRFQGSSEDVSTTWSFEINPIPLKKKGIMIRSVKGELSIVTYGLQIYRGASLKGKKPKIVDMVTRDDRNVLEFSNIVIACNRQEKVDQVTPPLRLKASIEVVVVDANDNVISGSLDFYTSPFKLGNKKGLAEWWKKHYEIPVHQAIAYSSVKRPGSQHFLIISQPRDRQRMACKNENRYMAFVDSVGYLTVIPKDDTLRIVGASWRIVDVDGNTYRSAVAMEKATKISDKEIRWQIKLTEKYEYPLWVEISVDYITDDPQVGEIRKREVFYSTEFRVFSNISLQGPLKAQIVETVRTSPY